MTHYHAGWNMSGYLPEMDSSYPFESFEEAKGSMLDDLDRVADHHYDAGGEEGETKAEDLDALARDLREESGPGWDGYVGYMHYWIVECGEKECAEEEEYA